VPPPRTASFAADGVIHSGFNHDRLTRRAALS